MAWAAPLCRFWAFIASSLDFNKAVEQHLSATRWIDQWHFIWLWRIMHNFFRTSENFSAPELECAMFSEEMFRESTWSNGLGIIVLNCSTRSKLAYLLGGLETESNKFFNHKRCENRKVPPVAVQIVDHLLSSFSYWVNSCSILMSTGVSCILHTWRKCGRSSKEVWGQLFSVCESFSFFPGRLCCNFRQYLFLEV